MLKVLLLVSALAILALYLPSKQLLNSESEQNLMLSDSLHYRMVEVGIKPKYNFLSL